MFLSWFVCKIVQKEFGCPGNSHIDFRGDGDHNPEMKSFGRVLYIQVLLVAYGLPKFLSTGVMLFIFCC